MATSTLGSGTLVLAGTTSGTTTVTATAVAGTTTLTLPAATDTLVGKATTDTLTNKTLTSPTLTGVATFAAGSAAAPAITTTGDTNTGIFFPAADTIAFTEGGAEAMRIDSSGNLGLGVTPSAWSGINNGAFQLGAGYGSLYAYSNAITLGSNVYYNAGNKYFSTGAASAYQQLGAVHYWLNAASGTAGNAITFTQAMTLDSSGKLLVGVTSPYSNPSAYGAVNIHTSSGISIADTSKLVADKLIFGSGEYYILNNSGIGVYLGSGNQSWSAQSDERLKDIIEPITNASEKVSSLRAVIGKYKTDEKGKRRSFLIAQDVQAVLPEAVHIMSDEMGTLGVQYTDVIPLLVAAIKEQSALITQLTARITALESA